MSNTLQLKTSLMIAALCAFSAVHADTMSKADYDAAKASIAADYKADKEACDKLAHNANDICMAQAKGKQNVARADLDYRRSGKEKDRTKLAMARADADYDVAKERCDDQSGNSKDVCLKEAKAAETKAKADAKMNREISEARHDANADKRDADYKVATEKCDAMAGDAKSNCIAAAKAKYGKS